MQVSATQPDPTVHRHRNGAGDRFDGHELLFDHRSEAEELIVTCARDGGVADTDMHYDKNFTSKNFNLAVTLQQDVTEAQIRDVACYFADRTDATGLAGTLCQPVPAVADRALRRRRFYHRIISRRPSSGLQQHRGQPQRRRDCRRRGGVLRMARSPIVADASLTAPVWNRPATAVGFRSR